MGGFNNLETGKHIAGNMRETDSIYKRLTGRTLESVAAEADVASRELFPPNSNVLYIGDPWQKARGFDTGAQVSVIDYAYGDEVEFNGDQEGVLDALIAEPIHIWVSLRHSQIASEI